MHRLFYLDGTKIKYVYLFRVKVNVNFIFYFLHINVYNEVFMLEFEEK